MAPPSPAVNDSLIFLYKCLQASQGKIDFHAVAADTGLTVGAARTRFWRLREKLEGSTDSGPACQGGSKQTPDTPKTTKSNASLKRKADPVTNQDLAEASAPKKRLEDLKEEEIPKRQTRGLNLDYNTSWMFDDDSSHRGSVEDSEDEYIHDSADVEEEDDDDLEMTSDHAKPASKRVKASTPATPTPKSANNRKKATIRTPRKAAPVVSQVTASCSKYSSNHPLPSIERSPPAKSPPGDAKRPVQTDGDIDLRSLQPGTFIALSVKRQQPVSPTMSAGPSMQQESSVTAGARAGVGAGSVSVSLASSQDSAGKMLQRELDEDDVIRPEDSISMVGHEDDDSSPSQTKFQRFRGLLTTWKTG